MTSNSPSPGNDPGLPDHPIDRVLELLGRLKACADLVETVTDQQDLKPHVISQFYAIAESMRLFITEADKQAFLVCDELNRDAASMPMRDRFEMRAGRQ